MKQVESRSGRRWFAKRVDNIVALIWTGTYQEVCDQIEQLRMDEAKGRHSKEKSLIYRIILSDLELMAAHHVRRPVDECEALYSVRACLGFATLMDEAIAAGAHARYCIQVGEVELAIGHATVVLKKLRRARRRKKLAVPAEMEAALKAISKKVAH